MNANRNNTWKMYFGQSGLVRLIDAVRQKFDALGAKGNVTLSELTPEESEAISALMEQYYPPGKPAVISLRKLEEGLNGTPFGGGIRDMLELLDGRPVAMRAERKQMQEESWRRMIADAVSASGLAGAGSDDRYAPICRWLDQLKERTAAGSRTLRALAESDLGAAERDLSVIVMALARLIDGQVSRREDTLVRLPVFAAICTGDAHAFDWKQPLGRLLVAGLHAVWGRETSGDHLDAAVEAAEDEPRADAGEGLAASANEAPGDAALAEGALLRRELYRAAGIADDDISSHVIFYAPSWTGEPEERVLTLRQVERADRVPRIPWIYAVENPSLFGAFLDRGLDWSRKDAMLVCVNGYPSAATLRWLDRCLTPQGQGEPVLMYAGDLDLKGLEIAAFLQRRYGGRFHAWRMSAADYRQVAPTHGLPLSDAEKSRFERLDIAWDEDLIPAIIAAGKKVYQELLFERLWQDLRSINIG